jgi:Cu/Zn superoxide dismutase
MMLPRFALLSIAHAAAVQPFMAQFNGPADSPKGYVRFTSADVPDGKSVMIIGIRLSNFDAAAGDFSYHVHTNPVPDRITDPEKDCKQAGGHLDARNITDKHVCDENHKQACQEGDLSGKYDKIATDRVQSRSTVYRSVYSDEFLTVSGPAGITGRSVVVHDKNKNRIACANIITSA